MLHKLTLVLTTAAVLGTAALVPTSASAWWGGGWHGWHRAGWGWGGPRVVVVPGFYRRWLVLLASLSMRALVTGK